MTDAPSITTTCCSQGKPTYLPKPSRCSELQIWPRRSLHPATGEIASKSLQFFPISPVISLLWTVSLPSLDTRTQKHTQFPSLYTPHCAFFPPSNPPLLPGAYLPTGRHGKSLHNQVASFSSQLSFFIWTAVILCCPERSHLCLSASTHLAFIRTDPCRNETLHTATPSLSHALGYLGREYMHFICICP